jgi:L-lactate dehydrogenase (cytochrome)
MDTMTCIEDLRQAAPCRVPRAFFDSVEGGSYTERTLVANCADFERITLRQRAIEVLRKELDVSMALTGVASVADIDRRVIAGI